MTPEALEQPPVTDDSKAHGLRPGVEKPPRKRLARDGDGNLVFETDAGANGHLRADTFSIAEVFQQERSGISRDVAGKGVCGKLPKPAGEMRSLGEPKQAQHVEATLVLQAIRRCGALEYARDAAKRAADAAQKALAPLPHSKHKQTLLEFAAFSVTRGY